MMHLRGLVLLPLFLLGGARRTIHIGDFRHSSQQQNNKLANGLAVSAESREALVPGVSGMGLFRRVDPRASASRDVSRPNCRRASHLGPHHVARAKVALQAAEVARAEASVVDLALVDHRGGGSGRGAGELVVVLVHGLDSWSGTWAPTAEGLAARGIGSVAVDLRGHGLSPLGRPEDFGPAQLAADLRATLCKAGLLEAGNRTRHLLLVGHSMGGRIAMRYAADYPEDLAAVVIEDMDCCSRPYPADYMDPGADEVERKRKFNRSFRSRTACEEALVSFGYESKRVEGWEKEKPPRVFPRDGDFWSAVNPHTQWLARRTVLSTGDAYASLRRIAALRACSQPGLAVHAWVAGDAGTVCSWDALPGGIRDMEAVLPGLLVKVFPRASHSIHNTDREAFLDAIVEVARAAK